VAHDGLFWRRAARWGATRGPAWFVRLAPPLIGWTVAACLPSARRSVRASLARARGTTGRARETRDVLATFANYAASLTDALASDTTPSRVDVRYREHFEDACRDGKGVIVVTAHTAGWDVIGSRLAAKGLDVALVKAAERDHAAGRYHDETRRRAGVDVAVVGDPLAALPLLGTLRAGGVVALQLDRTAPGMRTRSVPVLGGAGTIPDGPFRLAQLSGAPIVPVFCARRGHRHYVLDIYPPHRVARRATEAEIDRAAREVAAAMTDFLRKNPTQWFHFERA
jgi:phosphatidylinositol dimannoside acyltransferase